MELNYMQRKALRRLGRGKAVNRSMYNDPLIRTFLDTTDAPELPEPYNVVTWTDWVHDVRDYTPQLNEAGLAALEELGDTK